MSRSTPLNISYQSPTGSSIYGPSSPGLYIPLHKRNRSSISGTSSSSSSSRSSSPALSSCTSSQRSISPTPHIPDALSYSCRPNSLPIYTLDELITISSSPLSKLSPEGRTSLRDVAPHIVMSRKQRKSLEWNAREKGSQSQKPVPSSAESQYKHNSTKTWRPQNMDSVPTVNMI